MPLSDLKYLLDALRSKPYDYSTPVEVRPGVMRGMSNVSPMKKAQNSIAYTKYLREQEQLGETPLSYREWLGNHYAPE